MLSVQEIEKLKAAPICFDTAELADLYDIEVDRSLPKTERAEKYLSSIKNPYLFRVEDTIVKIEPNGKVRLCDALIHILTG